jgi:hypothetical protein
MSHVAHPTTSLRSQFSAHWILAVSGLLALLATVAVVLVLAIDGGPADTSSPVAQTAQPGVRADGGPDESKVAAAVSGAQLEATRPDEVKISPSITRN